MLLNFMSIALLLAPLALGEARLERVTGEKRPGGYIVKMKPGLSRSSILSKIGNIRYKYEKNVYNGFAGDFDEKTVELIRADPAVETIYEDGIVSVSAFITQQNATWNLNRICSKRPTLTSPYIYTRDETDGEGTDVYVLDTGIYIEHSGFEGRAKWGASFGYPTPADGNGHGTHCAGIVGSTLYGDAKKTTIIAVKILSDAGSGSVSDVVAGLDYVVQQKTASGRPAVILLSLSGSTTTTIDQAVAAVANFGVHVVAAAGNNAANAINYSPARAPLALIVGATDTNNAMAHFSNYGSAVDVFAPGVNIISAYKGSSTASAMLSGTSMAASHVAGLVAYLISLYGDMTPGVMSTLISQMANKGSLIGIPSGTLNQVIYNGVNC